MKSGLTILRLLAVATAVTVASQADAEVPVDKIVAQLRGQGYEVVEVRRTLLGRIKVEAVSEGRKRELVFDRTTGEILRDYVEEVPNRRPSVAQPAAPAATAAATARRRTEPVAASPARPGGGRPATDMPTPRKDEPPS